MYSSCHFKFFFKFICFTSFEISLLKVDARELNDGVTVLNELDLHYLFSSSFFVCMISNWSISQDYYTISSPWILSWFMIQIDFFFVHFQYYLNWIISAVWSCRSKLVTTIRYNNRPMMTNYSLWSSITQISLFLNISSIVI